MFRMLFFVFYFFWITNVFLFSTTKQTKITQINKIKISHNQVKCSTIIYLCSKLSPALPQMVLNASSRFYPLCICWWCLVFLWRKKQSRYLLPLYNSSSSISSSPFCAILVSVTWRVRGNLTFLRRRLISFVWNHFFFLLLQEFSIFLWLNNVFMWQSLWSQKWFSFY